MQTSLVKGVCLSDLGDDGLDGPLVQVPGVEQRPLRLALHLRPRPLDLGLGLASQHTHVSQGGRHSGMQCLVLRPTRKAWSSSTQTGTNSWYWMMLSSFSSASAMISIIWNVVMPARTPASGRAQPTISLDYRLSIQSVKHAVVVGCSPRSRLSSTARNSAAVRYLHTHTDTNQPTSAEQVH